MSGMRLKTQPVRFQAAEAIWPAGRRTVMNDFVGFRATVRIPDAAQSVLLRLAASTVYRAFADGVFLAHGPARAAHGHCRMDELPLCLSAGEHAVVIEVAGYNMNTYDVLDQPSFLHAEVVADSVVLAATSVNGGGFIAVDLLTDCPSRAATMALPRTSFAGSHAMCSASSASTRQPGPSPCAASPPCRNGAAPRCR